MVINSVHAWAVGGEYHPNTKDNGPGVTPSADSAPCTKGHYETQGRYSTLRDLLP